jgi:hypothetical protein
MLHDNLHRLLELHRARLHMTRQIQEQISTIPLSDIEGTALERKKWDTRVGQEKLMIERLEARLGVSA